MSDDPDALTQITEWRDRYARSGNAQVVRLLELAITEITLLRQRLEVSEQKHRLLERIALGGRGLTR
jgi:hypothetical protein